MRLDSLQILRFGAALSVVVHHLMMHFDTDMHVPELNVVGSLAVDIFFVLSGFIISRATLHTHDPIRFLAKRFARILPSYWLITCCVYLIGIVAPSLLSHPSTDPLDLVRSLAFVPYPNSAGLYQPILFVGWTLNYEMLFYIIFAALMAVFHQRWLLIPAVIATLVTLFAAHVIVPTGGILAFYTSGLILEFAAGVALHSFFHRRNYRPLPYGGLFFCIGLIMVAALNEGVMTDRRVFVVGIPALVTVAGAISWRPKPSRLVSLLILGGNASYAIYLTHPFVVVGLTKVAMGTVGNGPLALTGTGIMAIVMSVVVGLLLFLGFERPVHDWLKRPRKARIGRKFDMESSDSASQWECRKVGGSGRDG